MAALLSVFSLVASATATVVARATMRAQAGVAGTVVAVIFQRLPAFYAGVGHMIKNQNLNIKT